MKLKFTHRLLLLIGALFIMVMGIAMLLGGLQLNEIPIRKEGQGFFTLTRLLLLLGGLLCLAFGAFFLTLPHRMKQGKADFVTQKTPSGELKINVQAIETIDQKSLSQYEEIKLQHLQVFNTRSGVELDLRASLANNINIPQAVTALQKHIRQQLKATLDIDAKEVRIFVDKADLTSSSSPYKIVPENLQLVKEESKLKDKPENTSKGS